MVTLLLFFGVGTAAKALVVQGKLAALAKPDDATPTFLLRFTPVLLSALVFSGVAAAIMSTVNSFMSIASAAITHDLPVAMGKRVKNELKWGRIWTIGISVVAGLVAQASGTLVAFLGIFGWGLFASTLVPSLAVGLNWKGATREGALASIAIGLVLTLVLETLAYMKTFTLPAGVTISGISLAMSLLVFLAVSRVTQGGDGSRIDRDVEAVMDI
jgi:Na+/proline symporter